MLKDEMIVPDDVRDPALQDGGVGAVTKKVAIEKLDGRDLASLIVTDEKTTAPDPNPRKRVDVLEADPRIGMTKAKKEVVVHATDMTTVEVHKCKYIYLI